MTRRTKKFRKTNDQLMLAVLVLAALVLLPAGFSQKGINSLIIVLILLALVAAIVIGIMIYLQNQKSKASLRAIRVEQVDPMSGIEFERYVGSLLKSQGYKISFTPSTGDYGVDIVAVKGSDKLAVQTKCVGKRLGQEPIREVVAGMQHLRCNKCMVVTNRDFNPFAKALAASTKCVLVDREELGKWILEVK